MTNEEVQQFLKELRELAARYGLDVGGGGDFQKGVIKVGFRPKELGLEV